jgi:hypothetical protein
MDKYIKLVEDLKESFEDFNLYLQDNCKIPLEIVDLESSENHYLKIGPVPIEIRFPRSFEYAGVYVYFGYNKENSNELWTYIGKSSNKTMGHRLYNHFLQRLPKEKLNDQDYYINDGVIIEHLLLFPIKNEESWFLASSMEEFMIINMKDKGYNLLNKIGNL